MFEIDAERDQLRKDHDALARRLDSIPEMREQETAALRRRYADPQHGGSRPRSPSWSRPPSRTPEVPDAASPDRRRQERLRPGPTGTARSGAGGGDGRGKPPTVAQLHAEWVGLLRPDGPFIAVPVLTEAFPQFLDTVPDDTLAKLRQAWAEVQEAPDLLTPAWAELVLTDLLGYTPAMLAEGGALPEDLRTGPIPGGRLRPDAVAYGPDGQGGRAERLLIYRLAAGTPLTTASKAEPSPAEQAAGLCRHRGTPLALLTNGALWVLVHARPGEPATTAVFDADLWLEERALLRAFASLLGARRVLPPPKNADGAHSMSLAALFARSAEAQAEVTNTLGTQVRQAVELLVGELSRLDRESGGALLGEVEPRQVYRGALTVMMRLVFLLYAEEQRLLPVDLRPVRHCLLGRRACTPSSTRSRPCSARKWATGGPPPGPGCWPPSPPCTRAANTTRCASRPTAAACSTRHAIRGWTGSPSPTGWSTRCSARCSS